MHINVKRAFEIQSIWNAQIAARTLGIIELCFYLIICALNVKSSTMQKARCVMQQNGRNSGVAVGGSDGNDDGEPKA